jgi:hypothetical protein
MGCRRICSALTHILRKSTFCYCTPMFLLNLHYNPQRYLLPLLTQSYQARLSIKAHQKYLLTRLTTSIDSLKDTQSASFSVLPKPENFQEDPMYRDCHTLDAVIAVSGEKTLDISPFSVLRSAIEEFVAQGKDADTGDLFRAIEAKFPILKSEDGAQYRVGQISFPLIRFLSLMMGYVECHLADPINKPTLQLRKHINNIYLVLHSSFCPSSFPTTVFPCNSAQLSPTSPLSDESISTHSPGSL